jgi:hypothetical protein
MSFEKSKDYLLGYVLDPLHYPYKIAESSPLFPGFLDQQESPKCCLNHFE